MRCVDALRAQYFLEQLEREVINLQNSLPEFLFSHSFEQVIQDFNEQLVRELDQIILPTLCFELQQAKSKGLLFGSHPQDRYESFFLKNGAFSPTAYSIVEKYPFLFEIIDALIKYCSVGLRLDIS